MGKKGKAREGGNHNKGPCKANTILSNSPYDKPCDDEIPPALSMSISTPFYFNHFHPPLFYFLFYLQNKYTFSVKKVKKHTHILNEFQNGML